MRLALVAAGLLVPSVERGQQALVGLGGDEFDVAVDVGRGDPLRGAELLVGGAHLLVDPGDELVRGFVDRRGGCGGGRLVGRGRALAGADRERGGGGGRDPEQGWSRGPGRQGEGPACGGKAQEEVGWGKGGA